MLRQFRQVFARYVAQHLDIRGAGFALYDDNNNQIGHVDKLRLQGGRMWLTGWTLADRVELVQGDYCESTIPSISRPDVAQALEVSPNVGFSINQIAAPDPLGLLLFINGKQHSFSVRPIGAGKYFKSKTLLALQFMRQLIALAPTILRYLKSHNSEDQKRIKTALGLDHVENALPMESRLFGELAPDEPAVQPRKITIVIPVFNALDLLPEVLERVISHTDLPFRLILIEDCSTDAKVRPFLRQWATDHADVVELIENETNLGFIGSVNSAFKRALEYGDHVVLLNSDAFVPPGWASRLLRPISVHDNIASVTPMSNDAEIFSIPLVCARSDLKPGQADAIDATARRFHPEALLSVVPTGVGFCMAINIAYLRRIPTLDTTFGRGYGEEVDWCQKIRAIGGKHLGLPSLFVEHRGGVSFGSEEKQRLIRKNNQTIRTRYPDYDREVQNFIKTDPLITVRLALALAWVASANDKPVPIYLAHNLGGGADKYLDRRIREDLKTGNPSLVLRVGSAFRWQIEVHSMIGVVSGQTNDFEFVQDLLAPVKNRRIIYSCGVGDPDPVELPDYLLKLLGLKNALEVLFHDYFPVSPSYCLLDGDGYYSGPVKFAQNMSGHTILRPGGKEVSLGEWQIAWGRLLTAADSVVVFSQDSFRHVLAAYPQTKSAVIIRPHSLLKKVPQLKLPKADAPRVVGILGNINYAKGAAVVADMSEKLSQEPGISAVLIGNIDPAYKLPKSLPVHGNYQIQDIAGLATQYKITCWLIPSVWPETFSYTTHEALATGLPVYCFDLGAQGDAVSAAPNGTVIPFDPGADLAQRIIQSVKKGYNSDEQPINPDQDTSGLRHRSPAA